MSERLPCEDRSEHQAPGVKALLRWLEISSAFNQDSHRQIFSSVISVHSLSKSSYHI